MNRRSGALFTALYLKQCTVTLQQAYGGITPYDIHTKPSVPVSLTRSGYPRIIPSFHRQQIYKRDDKADMLVKLYLSFFSLSRAIKLAKRISPSLFASITDPMSDVQKFAEVRDWLRGLIRKLANRYLSQALSRPLYLGISWDPTWKALPTDRKRPGQSRRERGIFANFTSELLWFAMLRLSMSVNPALALGMTQKLTSKGSAALWSSITRYPRDEWNDWLSNISANSSVTIPESLLMEFDSTGDLFCYPGRLSHSVESGAGKRRVFAIGNYVNQRLLRPLHNWLMEALGDLKTDGTFNQSAPLDRLVGAKKIYSIDLNHR